MVWYCFIGIKSDEDIKEYLSLFVLLMFNVMSVGLKFVVFYRATI